MLDFPRARRCAGACTVHAMPVDGKACSKDVGCRGVRITTGCDLFSFLGQQNKSRSGALKASGLALKRDAERKVNKFHAQMTFIRLLSLIRDVSVFSCDFCHLFVMFGCCPERLGAVGGGGRRRRAPNPENVEANTKKRKRKRKRKEKGKGKSKGKRKRKKLREGLVPKTRFHLPKAFDLGRFSPRAKKKEKGTKKRIHEKHETE